MTFDATYETARARIELAYAPDLVRSLGHHLIDQLVDYFRHAEQCDGDVLPWREPADNVRDACAWLTGTGQERVTPDTLRARFTQLVSQSLARGHRLHDPRYIGHQVAVPSPIAGLFDALGAITNQAMAIYEMGPWATAAECALVEQLGAHIGWKPGEFSGLATHGGSLANLTALLTARNVALQQCWEDGVGRGTKMPVILVHSDAHYSIARAAGVLGLGTRQVLRVDLDAKRRMDPACLQRMLAHLNKEGQPVIAVVACACSTPIGAFDPLPTISKVCRQYGVWLHVDAAHGGSACLSDKYKHLVCGLELADSLIWDAHKTLFVPALCAFVFLRDRAHRFETFRQDAPYLFDPTAPGLAEYDSGMRTLECTKRAAAFGLWGLWSMFGKELFADMVDTTFAMGHVLYEKLAAAEDFVPLHEPQCNIVVFRHIPKKLRGAAPDRIGQFQLALRRKLVESGEFYIVSTKLNGIGALRTTVMNPLTTPHHFDWLLDALRRHGDQLLSAGEDRIC